MRNIRDFLGDILDAISAIQMFIENGNFDDFAENQEKIFAVAKGLEIIGEAVKNIPESIRSQYPEIYWKNIAGMRDKLVHEYWAVDVNILWKTARERLPDLKMQISLILEKLPEDNI